MPKKPSCAEFIVAAIRATRPIRKLKPGTHSGKALRMIFSLAKQVYSEKEFRRALKTLIDNGTVLLVAEVKEIKKNPYKYDRHDFGQPQKVLQIPDDVPLNKGWWFLNARGKSVDEREKHSKYLHALILYVVSDGLPGKVADFITGNGLTKTEQIIASMQK
ncbi:MAG: hypothetical protein ACYC6X_02970 [Minisyncoccota bacterium]